jgi:heterotetrameric sarcosine oxidase delta subunit
MRLNCPYCGLRDHQEFTYRGDATAVRPALDNQSIDEHNSYVFDRANPDGIHRELWNHTSGCRTHLIVERHTLTHEIVSCVPVGPFSEQLK